MNRFFDNFPLFKGKVSGKITLSLFMLLYSMLLVLFVPCKDRLLCFIAMLFSSLGDFFLNHTSLKERTKKSFYLGAIFFMIAHILYASAYYTLHRIAGFTIDNAGFAIGFSTTSLTFLILVELVREKGNACSPLMFFYTMILGMNLSIIFSFSYVSESFERAMLASVGVLLFFISDLFIGLETFLGVKSKTIRELVWWFYPIGQILIITAG